MAKTFEDFGLYAFTLALPATPGQTVFKSFGFSALTCRSNTLRSYL